MTREKRFWVKVRIVNYIEIHGQRIERLQRRKFRAIRTIVRQMPQQPSIMDRITANVQSPFLLRIHR